MSAPKKKKKPTAKATPKAAPQLDANNVRIIPAMWAVSEWPKDVAPFSAERAKRFIRENLDALDGLGVLTRPGKKLFVFGAKYMRFLETRSARVKGYQSEPNKKKAQGEANNKKAQALPDFASDAEK